MFYDKQPLESKNNYKEMLRIVGSLSRLFSESDSPYLYYRGHENIFSKYFSVDNNARSDDSADVYNSEIGVGIGLKTWVGRDDQKVAEFGKLRPKYENLEGLDLVRKISEYRNIRIRTTKNAHGLNEMFYHIVKRIPNAMQIYESSFEEIDISNIELISNRGNANNTYFTDGKHMYHFSRSKNTLFMIFEDMQLLDEFTVDIHDDPYDVLSSLESPNITKDRNSENIRDDQLCLRLYSSRSSGKKFVPEKSGLNHWNAGGRERKPNELYIPYPSIDRKRGNFFPPRDSSFDLKLPDGKWISAKVCQQDGKAIMSNPNILLGEWLLRTVFELKEGTVVTYDMLREFNVDSVIFTKLSDRKYSVDFGELGTYEKFYRLEDDDKLE